MKIEQTQMVLNPIRILLETREEAPALIEMVDSYQSESEDQSKLLAKISDAFTNMEVQI